MVTNTNEMHNVMESVKDTGVDKRHMFKNMLTLSTYVAEPS